MAAGSDLLDDFFNTDVDEKVVSDLVGSLESQLAAHHHHHHHHPQQPHPGPPEVRSQALANHVASPGVGAAASAGVQPETKLGISPEMPKTAVPGVQGSVINNSRPQSAVQPDSVQSAGSEAPGVLSQAKAGVLGTIATALPNHGSGNGKTAALQTMNGSNVVINSHGPGGHPTAFQGNSNPVPGVNLVNNGPAPVTKGGVNAGANTVIQTSYLATTNVSASVISSSSASTAGAAAQPTGMAGVPTTVALVRPLVHQGVPATQNGSNTVINSPLPTPGGVPLHINSQPNPAPSQVIKSEAPKTIIQTPQQSQPNPGNMVIGQTMQAGHLGPGGAAPAPGTPAAMGKATVSTVPPSLPRTPTAPAGGIRATIAPPMLAPRVPQPPNATNIQNFQLPPGMVLVRSENGQLLMIPQQALAQMQAQVQAQAQSQAQNAMAPRPATPTSAPPVQISTVQSPGAPLLARQVTPTTIIKQVSQTPTTVQPTTTLQRPPVVQNQIVLGSTAQTATLGTATAVQTGTPQRTVQGAATPTTATTETMENVKKCKNFLSTLIKLASSGKQSSETAANVKELVQNLLDGKIEAEDFTSRLYRELNSSPQPYLVPFLKRSLPALRQLTPDSAAFIQQSQQQQPSVQATTALTAVMLNSSVQRTAGKTTATVTNTLQQPVISLAQTAQAKPGQPTPLVIQQAHKAGAVVRPPQVTLTQTPMVALRPPQSRLMVTTQQQIQLNQLQTVPVVKPTIVTGNKMFPTTSAQAAAAQKNKLKEPGGGSFRDDDDINDVASMAGVNLSEESARILATNSELVGTLTRSCKDETFLLPAILQRRILEIGKKHGITEIHPDVVSYVSHATQQRLQNIVEKISETAQQKNISHKDDDRYEQSSDVRTQLKFFEQLDQIEKQRKDEQEREILMRAAKSRSRQEDPEQLRLKQKAKEMQQQELAQMRQRDANLTALAAIGPRKKRKVDSPGPGSGSEASSTSTTPTSSSGAGGSRQFTRQRITRVNLRDLIFCLENERETSHSLLLYKAFLK
ncbi:transcription initiation factor TFIID subunit 4 isoform X2 [Hyla sarda]|uniref:transcription initiation factor TFIID subunit 4 isoform X2 n=1 Tax=Hyla sarda TaxID=327740 RepID=UPI0024C2AD41|nr:transcription initiation factor TFIID subunit 4 isoform X2 [Hyla sarda]